MICKLCEGHGAIDVTLYDEHDTGLLPCDRCKGSGKDRTYRDDMTDGEAKDLAYYERNMIALRYADGWYYDTDNNWEGWKRVLSLDGGKMCFHIPDGFKVGNLPQTEPSWDGHTTEEKWARVDRLMGIDK